MGVALDVEELGVDVTVTVGVVDVAAATAGEAAVSPVWPHPLTPIKANKATETAEVSDERVMCPSTVDLRARPRDCI